MKNVTISVDERVLERAREVARAQGASLNQLLRRYLETLGSAGKNEERAEALLRLMEEAGGRSGGARFDREDAYQGRL